MRSRVPFSQKEKLTEQGRTKSRKAAQVPDTKAGPSPLCRPLSSQSRALGKPAPLSLLSPLAWLPAEILGDSAEMLEAREAAHLDTAARWSWELGRGWRAVWSLLLPPPWHQATGLCLNLVCDVT